MNGRMAQICPEWIRGRLANRLLLFPILAAVVGCNWALAIGKSRLFFDGDARHAAIFLVGSSLVAGLAGSILLVPPKRPNDVGPRFPISPGIVLWYGSAVVSVPQFLIGLPPLIGQPEHVILQLVLGWAAIYTFFISYVGDLLMLVFCGVVCGASRLSFGVFARPLGADDWLGILVWSLAVSRAMLLLLWGPFELDL